MLLDRLSLNVGENNVIYIELLSADTPIDELKYGDSRYDAEQNMLVWYGVSEDNPTGWMKLTWGDQNYTGALIEIAKNSNKQHSDVIYRIMNNDPYFNEQEYLQTLAGE